MKGRLENYNRHTKQMQKYEILNLHKIPQGGDKTPPL